MYKREAELVNEQVLADPLNMNLKLGGEGGWDYIKILRSEDQYKMEFSKIMTISNNRESVKRKKKETVSSRVDAKWQPFIEKVKSSDIDFSKFGWVEKVSKILEITPQKVNKWMKRYMLDFYEERCFKRGSLTK